MQDLCQFAHRRLQGAYQAAHRPLHSTNQLGKQELARRKIR
jgi:hypothetical protein